VLRLEAAGVQRDMLRMVAARMKEARRQRHAAWFKTQGMSRCVVCNMALEEKGRRKESGV